MVPTSNLSLPAADFHVIRGFLFIASFGFWIFLIKEIHQSRWRLEKPSFYYLLASVVVFLGFAAFLALQASGIDPKMFAALGTISLISPICFYLVRRYNPLDLRVMEACGVWMYLEKPSIARWILYPVAGALLGYFAIATYTIVVPSTNPRFAVRLAVVSFALMTIPSMTLVCGGLLWGRYWTEVLRTAVAAGVLPGIFNALLVVGLGLWSFDLMGSRKALYLFDIQLMYSPLMVISSIGTIIILYLAPYLAGAHRCKETMTSLQKFRLDVIDKILLELSSPKPTPHQRLHALRTQIESEMDQFWDKFPVLGKASAIEQGSLVLPLKKDLLMLVRSNDLRYIQWQWFLELTIHIEEAEQDLSQKDALSLPQAVSQRIKYFESVRTIQHKHLADLPSQKTRLVVLGTMLVTFILTKGLDIFWKHFERLFE